MKIEIYDPAMCCSSGLCGPAIDPVLVKVNDAIIALKKQNVEVERFNLAQQTKLFMENKTVADLLHNGGKKVLPITFVNGAVFKTGGYPSYEELCSALGIEPHDLVEPDADADEFRGQIENFAELPVPADQLQVLVEYRDALAHVVERGLQYFAVVLDRGIGVVEQLERGLGGDHAFAQQQGQHQP